MDVESYTKELTLPAVARRDGSSAFSSALPSRRPVVSDDVVVRAGGEADFAAGSGRGLHQAADGVEDGFEDERRDGTGHNPSPLAVPGLSRILGAGVTEVKAEQLRLTIDEWRLAVLADLAVIRGQGAPA